MLLRLSIVLPAVAWLAIPQPVFAQEDETLRLSEALYFDCSIAPADKEGEAVKFGVSYLEYADSPGRPQVNFIDPTKIVFQATGWASKGSFAFSRLTAEGPLFVWVGKQRADGFPEIDASFEVLTPSAHNKHADLLLTHFTTADDGKVSARKFAGDCNALNGADAYYKFSKGDAE